MKQVLKLVRDRLWQTRPKDRFIFRLLDAVLESNEDEVHEVLHDLYSLNEVSLDHVESVCLQCKMEVRRDLEEMDHKLGMMAREIVRLRAMNVTQAEKGSSLTEKLLEAKATVKDLQEFSREKEIQFRRHVIECNRGN